MSETKKQTPYKSTFDIEPPIENQYVFYKIDDVDCPTTGVESDESFDADDFYKIIKSYTQKLRDFHVNTGVHKHLNYTSSITKNWIDDVPTYKESDDKKLSEGELSYFIKLEDFLRNCSALEKLKDNYDGEGSSAINKDVLVHAVTFIRKNSHHYFKHFGKFLPIPQFVPDPNGDIDLIWDMAKGSAIASFQLDESGHFVYYHGKTFSNTTEYKLYEPSGLTSYSFLEWMHKHLSPLK